MANKDMARVVLQLAAEQKQLRTDFNKAEKIVEGSTNKMAQASNRAAKKIQTDMTTATSKIGASFNKMGGIAKASLAGLLAGVVGGGISGIVAQFQDISKGIATIGDQAKIAGLSLESFQELKFVAEQNRIGVDSLTDGIKELNLRADEFIATGAGSASEAFGRLGYGAEDLKNKLKDPSALFTEIIGKLQQLDRQSQIRIADEIFGGSGGEKFVQLIEQGEKGIKDTIREAHNLGAVMSSDVIARADELDRKFNAISTSVGTGLKTAIVEAATELQNFIAAFQGFMAQAEKRKNAVDAGTMVGGMFGTVVPKTGANTTEKTGRLAATPAAVPSQDQLSAKYLADYRAELALTNREQAIAAESTKILADAASRGLSVTKEQAAALAAEKVARDEGDASAKKLEASRTKSATATQNEALRVTELIEQLDFEYSLIGKTAAQQDKMTALRQAGAAATTAQQLAIMQKIDAAHQEASATDRIAEASREANDAARDFAGTLVDGFLNGTSAAEALGNALRNLGSRLIDSGLDQLFSGGGIGGLFGGLFGGGKASLPKFATGTNYAPGGAALVGERGPEIVNLPRGSQVIPNIPTAKMLNHGGGGGGAPVINFAPVIDARGADEAAVARLSRELQRLKGDIPAFVDKGIATSRQRGIKVR